MFEVSLDPKSKDLESVASIAEDTSSTEDKEKAREELAETYNHFFNECSYPFGSSIALTRELQERFSGSHSYDIDSAIQGCFQEHGYSSLACNKLSNLRDELPGAIDRTRRSVLPTLPRHPDVIKRILENPQGYLDKHNAEKPANSPDLTLEGLKLWLRNDVIGGISSATSYMSDIEKNYVRLLANFDESEWQGLEQSHSELKLSGSDQKVLDLVAQMREAYTDAIRHQTEEGKLPDEGQVSVQDFTFRAIRDRLSSRRDELLELIDQAF